MFALKTGLAPHQEGGAFGGRIRLGDFLRAAGITAGSFGFLGATSRLGIAGLGVAGLQGMGQLELFLACFGIGEITRGALAVDGRPVVLTSPTDAVRADIGIGLVPEDRKTEALFLTRLSSLITSG